MGELITNPIALRCCPGCQDGQAMPGLSLPRGLPLFCLWQRCSGKKRHQDQCGILSVTSKSNLLVDCVTRNLVGTERPQLNACSTKIYKHAELISRCSSRPGGEGKSVHPCSWCSCRHCGSLNHAFGRQKPVHCSSINEQRNVAMPRDYLEDPLRAA